MSIIQSKRSSIFLFLLFFAGSCNVAQAFFPFMLFAKLLEQKKQKRLVLILDVKRQESNLGACGYLLATALKDKVSPIIASAHSLFFVTSYFKPEEWNIYKKQNLVLFIPKNYLSCMGLDNVGQAGFNLDGWALMDLGNNKDLRGSDLHALLAPKEVQYATFADLSSDSVQIICDTIKKDKTNSWKVYAVGHGAPDASQVVGLNIGDFEFLLEELEKRSTDFFVYQTCFGGSTSHLRGIYGESIESFKKFSFPIISCALTNSVSFGAHPDAQTSFKGLFERVNSTIMGENKKTELLQAVNELNKALDYASLYHFSNNLLLIRMPKKEFFEPVADNRFVYNLTEFNALAEISNGICNNNFKCLLVNHPVLNGTYDFSHFTNFMIASGVSRPDHYIKEIVLKAQIGKTSEECFVYVTELFNSLAYPEESKKFFVPIIKIGDSCVLTDVTITQERTSCFYDFAQTVSIEGFAHDGYYTGSAQFAVNMGVPECIATTIARGSEDEAEKYHIRYDKMVTKHLKKKHLYPLHAPSSSGALMGIR